MEANTLTITPPMWSVGFQTHYDVINSLTPVYNVSKYIITSMTACPLRFAAVLTIMSVSNFIIAVILYYSTTNVLSLH